MALKHLQNLMENKLDNAELMSTLALARYFTACIRFPRQSLHHIVKPGSLSWTNSIAFIAPIISRSYIHSNTPYSTPLHIPTISQVLVHRRFCQYPILMRTNSVRFDH